MRTLFLVIGSFAFSMAGIAQAVQFGSSPEPPKFPSFDQPSQAVPQVPAPLGTGEHQPSLPRPAVENTQHIPLPLGAPEQQQVDSDEILRRVKELQAADPLTRQPEPGDDELRRLLKERYNAALFAYRYTDAAYNNGTVAFDEFMSIGALMLRADLELSDKPADQIAAIERYLVFAKENERRVFSLYKSQSRGGEKDKYEKAKYMRLDAEIQLLRVKRNAVTTK